MALAVLVSGSDITKNSMKAALCGILAALSTVVMFFTGIIPVATLALPAIAGCLLIPVVAEVGISWGFGTFAVCAGLSFLLAPDRETAFVYLFFGWYPILRPKIAALPSRPLRVLARIAVCSAAALLLYGLVLRLMGLTAELLESAWYFNAALLAAGNVVFLLTDSTLARLTSIWHWKLKKYLYR